MVASSSDGLISSELQATKTNRSNGNTKFRIRAILLICLNYNYELLTRRKYNMFYIHMQILGYILLSFLTFYNYKKQAATPKIIYASARKQVFCQQYLINKQYLSLKKIFAKIKKDNYKKRLNGFIKKRLLRIVFRSSLLQFFIEKNVPIYERCRREAYLSTPSSFPTFINASIARSRCSRLCPALS